MEHLNVFANKFSGNISGALSSPSSEFLHVCLASSPAPDCRVLGNYLSVLEIE
jgi:hypothetical protein